MTTSETCANGCIPSSPRVGCPVHGPVRVGPFDVVVDPRLGPGDFYFLAKPPEPAKCEHCTGQFYCVDHAPAWPGFTNPPPPPEPAPCWDFRRAVDGSSNCANCGVSSYWHPCKGCQHCQPFRDAVADLRAQLAASEEKRIAQRLRLGGRIIDLEAQIAAAQAENTQLRRLLVSRVAQLQAATERAEKAERERDLEIGKRQRTEVDFELERKAADALGFERDAAIKAKEEAERAYQKLYNDPSNGWRVQCEAAEATAGELRAALEAALDELEAQAGGPQDQTEEEAALLQHCRQALTAHSKAVGP